jgi:ABC-type methionine transport system permease subunit
MRAMPPVLRDLTLLLVAFVGATALAAALGAANLGTAATFGQVAFAGALVYLLLRA